MRVLEHAAVQYSIARARTLHYSLQYRFVSFHFLSFHFIRYSLDSTYSSMPRSLTGHLICCQLPRLAAPSYLSVFSAHWRRAARDCSRKCAGARSQALRCRCSRTSRLIFSVRPVSSPAIFSPFLLLCSLFQVLKCDTFEVRSHIQYTAASGGEKRRGEERRREARG